MRWFIITSMLVLCTAAQACTTCGCAAYNSFMGISGYTFNHFIGLTYNYYTFSELDEEGGFRNNTYQRAELRGAYALNQKFQFLGGIPFVINSYNSSETKYAAEDIGDANVSTNYLLYTNTDSILRKATHWIVLNAGIELPTGFFNTDFRSEKLPPAISAGSASTDMFAGIQYTVATMHWNFRTAYQFKLNTTNSIGYNFGEQHSAEMFAARKCTAGKMHIVPYAGFRWEHLTQDNYYTMEMVGTGADNYALYAGNELNFKKFNIGLNAALPLSSTVGDVQVQNILKMQAYVSYTF